MLNQTVPLPHWPQPPLQDKPHMSLPHAMTAIAISEPGGPDVLQTVSVPVPVPGSSTNRF